MLMFYVCVEFLGLHGIQTLPISKLVYAAQGTALG